tara:strand:- start:40 stop:231 length:192 start_codon:yes stop_codon:yes gene_type:complete
MLSAEYALMRAKNTAMWKDVFMEDIQVLEGMQAGCMARLMTVGNFLQLWTIQHIIFINGWRSV